MGARMRAYDWDSHPLGNPADWPQSLQMNIRLLLNSGFPMFIWWSDGLYSFHNDAYIPALGNKHPWALGERASVIWAEVWDQLGNIVDNIFISGSPFYTEGLFLMLERKGFREETYWTFSYSPAFNDAGEAEGIFCACYEVTGTIIGQRRLKILKDISDAMAQPQTLEQACQTACNILQGNKEDIPFSLIYLLNGAGTAAELVGQAGTVPPALAPHTVELSHAGTEGEWPFSIVLETKQPQTVDLVFEKDSVSQAAPGAVNPRQAIVLPVFMPGQEHVIGFFVSGISPSLAYDADYGNFHKLLAGHMATAITIVQAREETARQQKNLSDMFQQAPVAISILRGPYYIVDIANTGICELWGKKQEEVLGKPLLDALPEVRNQGIKELLDGVMNTGVPYVNNEMPIKLVHGGKLQTMYFSFVYHPQRNVQGDVTGVIVVAIGIDEQVETRREIEAMNKELLATNADLDNFVYSASHDLRAPISNIEGLMEALVYHMPPETLASATVSRLIELIQGSIERFKRVVTDLSEVTKIQREASEDIALVKLPDVVNEVRLDFNSDIEASGAQIETVFATSSAIRFSTKNIRSIVYNLLSNALKYRHPERQPHIRIWTEVTPKFVVLAMADNGLGFDMTVKEKIFSMFKRLHDHVEGSGIGLYIVKRIIENAGGKIKVESKVGEGTTFKVYFVRNYL